MACLHRESARFCQLPRELWCDGSSAIVLIPEPQSRQAQEAVGVVTRDSQGGRKASGLPSCTEAQRC